MAELLDPSVVTCCHRRSIRMNFFGVAFVPSPRMSNTAAATAALGGMGKS